MALTPSISITDTVTYVDCVPTTPIDGTLTKHIDNRLTYVDGVPTTHIDGTHTKHIDNRLTIAVSVYIFIMCVFYSILFSGFVYFYVSFVSTLYTTCELVCIVCVCVFT